MLSSGRGYRTIANGIPDTFLQKLRCRHADEKPNDVSGDMEHVVGYAGLRIFLP